MLHRGRVVYERYDGCMDENTLHGAMSVTKSLTGLLGEMIVKPRLERVASYDVREETATPVPEAR